MSNKLPSKFIRSLIENYNIEQEDFVAAHSSKAPSSIRLNPLKPADIFLTAERVPWCSTGRYLDERPSFTADPMFHAGCYYVQEASSMFLEHVLKSVVDLGRSIRVLDLCAAPGGKSTLISSLLSKDSVLVSNEIIRSRVPMLSDNLTRWGTANTVVTNNDPRDFSRLPSLFDVLVVDAPCSGSGMFRKEPDSINEWSENAVELCSQRQQRILADAYPTLKEDGILIYSTCSYSKEENEDICDWLSDTFQLKSLQIPVQNSWNVIQTTSSKNNCYGYRFYPHKVKGEGFFIACFQKTQIEKETKTKSGRDRPVTGKVLDIVNEWIIEGNIATHEYAGELHAITPETAKTMRTLTSALYIKKSGVRLGKIKGNDLVPDHELAMSLIVNPRVPRIELSREEAIAYLKRDDLTRSHYHAKGWALVCYRGHDLGWVKVLENRINNYLPKELRILNQNIG